MRKNLKVSRFFFYSQHGQGAYIDKINRMRENNKHRLLVDLNDLRQYDIELTRRCDLVLPTLSFPFFSESRSGVCNFDFLRTACMAMQDP